MSTYSTNLALELIGTGEQSGTWGTTTNTNLGTLIEQAISGYATQACTGGTDTITIPNGATGVARNMFLELTGTGGGTLVVPSNKKLYFIYNNTSTAITVKVSGQTGVSVPAAAKMVLVSNGTDVVVATNYLSSLTLGSALPIASGGTGATSASAARTALSAAASGANSDITSLSGLTTPLSVAQGGTGSTTASDARTALSVPSTSGTGASGTWGISVTGSAATATTATTATNVTGTVAAANGGTGLTSPGTAGNILTSTGTGWQSSAASTFVSSVTATSPLSSSGGNTPDISLGTVPVTKGGTGVTSATAYAVLTGGTTSTGAHQSVASVGTSGQVLTSNGAGALPTFQTVSATSGASYKTSGSGTFTIPAGVTSLTVVVVGPGSRGSLSGGGAGGAGGVAIKTLSVTAGNTLNYSVAAENSGVNTTVTSGTQSITSIIGGYAAQPGDSSDTGGTGGTASGGDINIPGQPGQNYDGGNGAGGAGGSGPYGFGGWWRGSATGYGSGSGSQSAGTTIAGPGLVIFQY